MAHVYKWKHSHSHTHTTLEVHAMYLMNEDILLHFYDVLHNLFISHIMLCIS